MATTALNIVTRVQKRIRDLSYPSSDILDFINDTVRDIYNRHMLPEQEKTYTDILTAGNTTFEYRPDHSTLMKLIIINPSNGQDSTDITQNYLPYDTFTEAFPNPASQSPTRPYIFTLHNKQIWFSQPVDLPYIMRADYIKVPNTITQNTDLMETPDEFTEAIVYGVCARCEETKDNFDKANYYMQKYELILTDYVKRSSNQITTIPTRIKPLMSR